MYNIPRESKYPQTFRKNEVIELVNNIQRKRSVEFIGMKRVGISNFLRFFIYNSQTAKKYFNNHNKTLFIPVDLNNLIECELFPFWLLTFKRVVDNCTITLGKNSYTDKINNLFDKSIQTKDLFITIDSLRQSLNLLVERKTTPVLFFIGFDRIVKAVTEDFYNNLQGLRDDCHKELVYILTSFRDLTTLRPDVFDKNSLSSLLTKMYLQPAVFQDLEVILKTLEIKYNLKLDKDLKNKIFELSGGHVQYLFLSVVSLYDHLSKYKKYQKEPIEIINSDERIILQSEELYSSLTTDEKQILIKILQHKNIIDKEKIKSRYLWDTGMVNEEKKKNIIFSAYYRSYLNSIVIRDQNGENSYLTKKEHILFQTLKLYLNTICERDTILEKVWPEYMETGVSDWAVDRLVARLRKKLESTNSKYKIKTIKTRGFTLEEK